MSDILNNGRRFRGLNVVDSYSRDFLGYEADTLITSKTVGGVLDRLVWFIGISEIITVNNGSEFIGKALDAWAYRHGVNLVFIQSGKPVENTYIESFNEGLGMNA